jgi:hypothetical protein
MMPFASYSMNKVAEKTRNPNFPFTAYKNIQ